MKSQSPTITRRLPIFVIAFVVAAAFSPIARGQDKLIFGPTVYDSVGWTWTPWTANFQQFVGDFTSITCNPGVTSFPSAINPTPTISAGYVTMEAGSPGGFKKTCTAMDNDSGMSNTSPTQVSSVATFGVGSGLDILEPISTASGELHHSYSPDLSLGGPLPLAFQRYYASFINANGLGTKLGNNWAHNFEWLLNFTGPYATVSRPDGTGFLFVQSGNAWQLLSTARNGYQFATTGTNTYQFLDPTTNLIYTFAGTAATLGLSTIQDRNGNTLTVMLPANGSAAVSDGLGRSLMFTYDPASGNVSKVADQTGRVISFAYTGSNLTQFTDANGKVETFAYTTSGALSGLMTGDTLALGNVPVSQTFDSIGRVATQADSESNTTTLTYDQPVGSTAYKNALGVSMSHTSRNYANFASFTDPDLQTVSVTNDNKGRRTSVTDRLGDRISVTYHSPSGYVASETNAASNTTSYAWTAQVSGPFTFFNLTQVQYADGTSQSFTYDAHGNAISSTDQAGNVWKFAYNNRGQVTSATDPLNRVASYAYNSSDATLASTTDAAGNKIAYSYDSLKRVSKITFGDGTTPSFTYDNRDNVLTVTDERGKTTTFVYSANNQVQAVTDALGKSSSVGYDTNNHAQKVTDRTGQSTLVTNNALQLTNSITTPAGEIYRFAYDTHNRLASAADPLGKSFSFAYDKEDVPASMTDALSRELSFTTNKLGHVTQITTPLSENYAIARDKLERVTSASDPTGVATTLSYDARGALSGIAITGGLSVSMSRDASGRLTGVIDPNGGAWGLSYDGAGRLGSRGDPLQRSISYSYDTRNRVAAIQTPLGTATLTYDGAGNLTGRAYSDGTNLGYTFDADNRLTSASGVTLSYDAEARVTGSNGLVIARDANGRIGSISYGPGKTAAYAYNSAGLLASVSDWIAGSTTFTYDAAHQLIAIKRPNGLGTQFTYDADGRLASITEDAGSSIAIKRDGAGRVVSENRSQPQSPAMAPGVLPLSYDVADQVSGFGYDGMGRVTSDIVHAYTWDLASRLTAYSGAGGPASVAYDGLGMRTSVASQGSTQNFIWNYATGLPSLATVQNGSPNSNPNSSIDQRYYVYTPDGMLLYAIDASNNARHFYHFDEMGSTVLLTNDAGAVSDSYGISPYGETVSQNGSTPNPFTWLGAFGVMQESSTGLYYMRARYYDPATARFLSPDPIISANPMRANPYQYALGNPVRISDPDGQGPRDDDDKTTMDDFAALFALFAVGYVDPEYVNQTGQRTLQRQEQTTLPALETNAPSTFHVNPAESQEGLPYDSPVRSPRLPTTASDGSTTSFTISIASGPATQPLPLIEIESGPTDEQSQAALNFLNVLVRLRQSSPCGPPLFSIRTGGNLVDPTKFRQTFWNTNRRLP